MSLNQIVPLLAVKDMTKSLAFYQEGLGFELVNKWVDEGVIRWCRLQSGSTAVMLQEFRTEGVDARHFSVNKGEGISLCIFCDDAVAYYHHILARGVNASEPFVGNGLWVTSVADPDGYRYDFESPTDVAEGTKLSSVV